MEGSTNSNEHIGTAELAKLLEEYRKHAESVLDAADMHPHFSACSDCRERFEELAVDHCRREKLFADTHQLARPGDRGTGLSQTSEFFGQFKDIHQLV